jgi:hypothetical protein
MFIFWPAIATPAMLIQGNAVYILPTLLPKPLKGQHGKKSTMSVVYCPQDLFKKLKNKGCLKLFWRLPAVIYGRESILGYDEAIQSN